MNNKYPAGYVPMTHHEHTGGFSQNNNRGGYSNGNSRPDRPRRHQQSLDTRESNNETRSRVRISGRRIGYNPQD